MRRFCAVVTFLCLYQCLQAQVNTWQQRINYDIAVNLNVTTNSLSGTERIDYYNNSPDTLRRVFFHTYWNAFQPNSSMDVRSRETGKIKLGYDKEGREVFDWDPRIKDRILNLKPTEIGYQKVSYVRINAKAQKLIEHESILEVVLDRPILPRSKTTLEISFEAQVPIQILRSGRDNAQGVRYTMSQWYPKMVEYDYTGWNANPYILREFHGVWGDYNVKVSIDKNYMLAGSGTLQNGNQLGFGYEASGTKITKPTTQTLTWNFVANNVHDFVWTADPTYTMIKRQVKNGPLFYFVYRNLDSLHERFRLLADTIELAYPLIAKTFGAYPYKNFSFIQGGDGAMEYPMAALLKGGSVGSGIHEFMHSWYHGMLASNEGMFPWMDEGFTNYGTERILSQLRSKTTFGQENNYDAYYKSLKFDFTEPLTMHADHYNTNYAYGINAYAKGAIFVSQLGYIVGDRIRDSILLEYYREWRYKHPNPNDFMRVAERVSGMELDWYKDYWINTTKTINYAIDSLWEDGGKTKVRIRRTGAIPMPMDVQLIFKDSSKELHYIPLDLMYGQKPSEDNTIKRFVNDEWRWTHPTYTFETSRKILDISEVQIDPSQRLADIEKANNILRIRW
jgi:hypothetical protein